MKRIPRLACYLAAAVLAGGCCRSLAEKAVDVGTDGAVKIADGGVTFTGDGGSVTTGATATLPADWPADVPIYPGGKIKVVSAAGTSAHVVFTTVDPPAMVTKFYKTNLPGWVATMDLTGPDGGIAQKKKGKNALTINITKSDDGSAGVSLSFGPT